jgi:hypothetical protein
MIMGYVKGALALLEAGGIVAKLIAGGALIAALLIGYGVWHHKVYQSGVDDTIAGIAREDARFIDRARKARGRWQDCRDQGRGWDQSAGRCL